MDSQIVNGCAEEWLKKAYPTATVRREVTHGDSRFDFYVEEKGKGTFIEVKGVTLEANGVAMFPDAPTQRGVKHINGLISLLDEGYGAKILFIVQMKEISLLRPNDVTHPEFGQALRRAARAGVEVLALDCNVTPDSVVADSFVRVEL
jgi:sugar fermentation stimulation protein A